MGPPSFSNLALRMTYNFVTDYFPGLVYRSPLSKPGYSMKRVEE